MEDRAKYHLIQKHCHGDELIGIFNGEMNGKTLEHTPKVASKALFLIQIRNIHQRNLLRGKLIKYL